MASLENQKHNDTIMLAVYFSLPRAAWQNVTVKSSRHERLTDVYFATRLHALLLKASYTCQGMLLPRRHRAAAPRGSPAASPRVGARGSSSSQTVSRAAESSRAPHRAPAARIFPSTTKSSTQNSWWRGQQQVRARCERLIHITIRTEARCILGLEKKLGFGTDPGLG